MTINKKKKKKNQIPVELNKKLLDYSKLSNDDVLKTFNSSYNGITKEEYEVKKEQFGPNKIGTKKQHRWYHSFIDAILNPFSIILIIIAVLNACAPQLQDWASFTIIVIILFVTCFIKIFQEIRSNKASERLNDMIETTIAIERDGVKKEMPIDEIVPGDIIHLAAGDMVPADLMVLSSKDLFITQSALTGESEPVEKIARNENTKDYDVALESTNLCFMGTSVASGTAKAIALTTGNETYFGRIAKSITKKRPKTNFDKGIKSVSLLLLITTLAMIIVVYILQGTIGNDWIKGLTFALALAVGLTPELLPMIVTVNLAKQAFKLSKQKTIVKNINSIQSFGAMDVLCTDKTGTLTEDKIVLEKHINIEGKEDNRVLIYGYLNSYFQTGLKNLLDIAIIEKADVVGLKIADQFNKIDEIPFDFQRRRMSVVIKDTTGKTQLITKGAIEEILSICKYAEFKNKIIPIDNKLKKKILLTVQSLNEQGMRVIAIAANNDPLPKDRLLSTKDENDMKLIGYIALLDPPKYSSRNAIIDLQKKGVQVKVLTGDNDAVARYVCSQVGLRGKKMMLGNEIENMTQDQLEKKVMNITIFAKLSPEQKTRVVMAIKANKHIVGFMGDGINDASAMRAADLGISVDTAVDIAKESADIILLEKDLTILGQGCVEGRKTYANIIKYIKMTVSSNFGNMLSMLVASIWLSAFGILPMRPEQILILNLIYDFAQMSLPWDHVDKDFYNKPRSWNAKSILRFMLFMGPVSSIFDITTFLIMFYVMKWNSDSTALYFQTGWFLESLLTQTAVVIVLRSNKTPFIHTYPSLPVVLSLLLTLTIGLMLVLTPIGFSGWIFQPLSTSDASIVVFYIFIIALGYMGMAQVAKKAYIKIFGDWL